MDLTIQLEESCPDCEGYGTDSRGNKCKRCNGTKEVPSEFGKELLYFLTRYQEKKYENY
jgi:DnaJ-class molecular chaperone